MQQSKHASECAATFEAYVLLCRRGAARRAPARGGDVCVAEWQQEQPSGSSCSPSRLPVRLYCSNKSYHLVITAPITPPRDEYIFHPFCLSPRHPTPYPRHRCAIPFSVPLARMLFILSSSVLESLVFPRLFSHPRFFAPLFIRIYSF